MKLFAGMFLFVSLLTPYIGDTIVYKGYSGTVTSIQTCVSYIGANEVTVVTAFFPAFNIYGRFFDTDLTFVRPRVWKANVIEVDIEYALACSPVSLRTP